MIVIVTEQQLESIKTKVGEIEDLKVCIKSFYYGLDIFKKTGMPGVKNRIQDPTSDKALLKADLEFIWNDKINILETEIKAVEKELSRLEPRQRRIIRLYYFKGYSDRRIGQKLKLSRQWTCMERRAALRELAKQ